MDRREGDYGGLSPRLTLRGGTVMSHYSYAQRRSNFDAKFSFCLGAVVRLFGGKAVKIHYQRSEGR